LFSTKIDEIGDILQLANGLNGPNRLNLTKVGPSARINGFVRRLKLAANGVYAQNRLAVKQREL